MRFCVLSKHETIIHIKQYQTAVQLWKTSSYVSHVASSHYMLNLIECNFSISSIGDKGIDHFIIRGAAVSR